MPKYYVYILRSSGNRHYIGFTSNLARRIYQHNKKHKGFTGRKNESWALIASLDCPDKISAMKMEKHLKLFKNSEKVIEFLKTQKGSEHPDDVGTGPAIKLRDRPA
ncbi:MAG: GIY-YIG nuclease family protein [Bacteroidetes bacterium]|nr:GIY-YIG nuclease family protein [Bacteroidota bacterium]